MYSLPNQKKNLLSYVLIFYLSGELIPKSDCYTYLGIPLVMIFFSNIILILLLTKFVKHVFYQIFIKNPYMSIKFKKLVFKSI